MDVARARKDETKAFEEGKDDEKKQSICDGQGNGNVEYCGPEKIITRDTNTPRESPIILPLDKGKLSDDPENRSSQDDLISDPMKEMTDKLADDAERYRAQ